MKIGITGHQSLDKRLQTQGAHHSEAEAWVWVEEKFVDVLAGSAVEKTIVISSLAAGADQRLSRLASDRGASLEVIVPAADLITTFTNVADRDEYESLLARAIEIIHLDFPEPSEAAYFAAGKQVVDRADMIIAVWDGRDAEGLGGTGDVVTYAHEQGLKILQLDPIRRRVHQISSKE
jgi:hypothetical protein